MPLGYRDVKICFLSSSGLRVKSRPTLRSSLSQTENWQLQSEEPEKTDRGDMPICTFLSKTSQVSSAADVSRAGGGQLIW